mgnify:CR=1 FL=1
MDRNKAEKRMATAPVGRLMLQMGTPMILSMMLQAVYNIVDSYLWQIWRKTVKSRSTR